MIDQPLVSVVIPFYNAEHYLAKAIQSILNQSYKNFELLLIDDGSRDRSYNIAADFQQRDRRVLLIRQESNRGLVAALNLGLEAAQGDYIARMDADDISLPDRLSKQVEVMELCPEIGILGCNMRQINQNGDLLSVAPIFLGDLSIRWHILFENPFHHPTVMMRRSVLNQLNLKYDPDAKHSEDYELWSRLLLHTKGENLKDVLVYYRVHPASVSHNNSLIQRENSVRIGIWNIQNYLPDMVIDSHQIEWFVRAMLGTSPSAKRYRARSMPLYLELWTDFCRLHHGNPELLELKPNVIAWAARMILYPFFQPGWVKVTWQLTKKEWMWPFYLLGNIRYFRIRKRVLS